MLRALILWPFARPLAILCLLAACLSTSFSCDRQPEQDARVFRFINRGDIFTLDLNDMSYGQDIRVTYLMREGLFSPTGPEHTPEPAGASGCDISADKCVYTFHLRPEARWSNGDSVTAADYIFSWRHMLEQPGEYTYLFSYIRGAEQYSADFGDGKHPKFETVGLESPDAHTLRVTLDRPVPYFLDLVAFTPFYPRNEKSMAAFKSAPDPKTGRVTYDDLYTRPPAVVCNGPFTLTEWKFKRILRFVKNPNYWDAAHVKLDEVDMVVNDNMLSGYLQFEAKAVDWICEVPAEIAADLRTQHAPGLMASQSFGTAFLSLTCLPNLPQSILGGAKNPMADIRVRQALTMSIDKTFLTDQITRMGEQPATTYIPPGTLPGYKSMPGLPYDVAKAKQLLAEAGYPDGRGFPQLPFLYNTENATRARIAQALKQQWKQALGIDIEIEGVEGKIFTQRVSSKEFAIATVSWYGDYPDVSTFTDKYVSSSLQNDASWVNPKYDALLHDATMEPDVPKRLGLLQQAEHLINTEVPIIPMYHYVNVMLLSDRVKGIAPNPRQLVNWKEVSKTISSDHPTEAIH